MIKLYLDDLRTPTTEGWTIVRSYQEFVDWITKNGLPDIISFDHDLADVHYKHTDVLAWQEYYDQKNREMTGYDCAKWLCEYCWTNGVPIPRWNVHSANTVGRDNIESLLKHYEKRLNN